LSPPSSTKSSPTNPSRTNEGEAPVTIRRFSATAAGSEFTLPADPRSVEGVEFLGFNRSTAETLFDRWSNRPDPDQNPDDLVDYVLAEVSALTVPPLSNCSPNQAMEGLGVSRELREAILDPAFTDLLWTQSVEFWLEDTIQHRWATLFHVHSLLKAKAFTSLTRRKDKKRLKIEDEIQDPFNLAPEVTESQKHSASLVAPSKGMSLPAGFTIVEAKPKIHEDHIILWKGMDPRARVHQHPLLAVDGTIDVGMLASASAGDVNAINSAWYWTRERETAEIYREYAARRNPRHETWLVQVQVPQSFVSTLTGSEIYYSPDWKELVWNCRMGKARLPSKFDHFLNVDLVQGHICKGVNEKISKIPEEEIWRINEDYVLKLKSGQKSTQWVIMNVRAALRMADEMKGKMHIDIHAPTNTPEKPS
jgi:hypothetical protein